MESDVAQGLKPWAKPVKLGFSAFQVGFDSWHELPADSALWGCRLQGPQLADVIVFALLKNGWPVIADGRRKIIVDNV